MNMLELVVQALNAAQDEAERHIIEPFGATLNPYTKELLREVSVLSTAVKVFEMREWQQMRSEAVSRFKQFKPELLTKNQLVNKVSGELDCPVDYLSEGIKALLYLSYLTGCGLPPEEYKKHLLVQEMHIEETS